MSLTLGTEREPMSPFQNQILMKKAREKALLDEAERHRHARSPNISQGATRDSFFYMHRKESGGKLFFKRE